MSSVGNEVARSSPEPQSESILSKPEILAELDMQGYLLLSEFDVRWLYNCHTSAVDCGRCGLCRRLNT